MPPLGCTSTPNFDVIPLDPDLNLVCELPLCVLQMQARYRIRFDDGQCVLVCSVHGDAVKYLADALAENRAQADGLLPPLVLRETEEV